MTERNTWRETGARWLKFNAVGAMGVAVQLGTLALLTHLFPRHVLLATAAAVEAAVLHNFAWHERYTWADRTRQAHDAFAVARRLVAFNLGNGAVSLVGNLALMALLAGWLHLRPMLANVVSIVACSLVNFVIGEKLIFAEEADTIPEDQTAALAGMATAFCIEEERGAADLVPGRRVGHAHEVALRERQEEQRGGRGEGQAEGDVLPRQQRRERPEQVEQEQRRPHAQELLPRPPHVEGHASQPI